MYDVISNQFNINIDKKEIIPPPTHKDVISNQFNINIDKKELISDDIFESIELLTTPDIKKDNMVRVAIRLKTKTDIGKVLINPKVESPEFKLKNIQWEKGTVLTDYRTSVTEISQRSTNVSIGLDAITSTVSKDYYTKDDIEGKSYQTASDVKQTVDKLEIKFSESGGYNHLYNGGFKDRLNKWSVVGNAEWCNGNVDSPNGLAVKMTGTLKSVQSVSQYRIELKEASTEHFTASYYTYVSDGEDGVTNRFRKGELILTYDDGSTSWHGLPDVTEFNKWEKKHVTVKPTKKVINVGLSLYNRDTTRTVYYSACMIDKGQMVNSWSPNPNEVSDGIINIDKDGISVSNSDSNSTTTMDSSSFRVENNKGGTIAEFSEYSNIPNIESRIITAETVYANNIVYAQGTRTLYVDLTNGKDTNSGYSNSKLKTIQEALDRLGKMLVNDGDDSIVYIEVNGSGKQNVSIRGFNGGGIIVLRFANGTKLHCDTFDVKECDCRIKITGNDTWSLAAGQIINTTDGSCIYVRNSKYVEIYNMCIVGRGIGKGYGITSSYGANVYVNSCEVDRFNSAIRSEYNGVISMYNTRGSDLNYNYSGVHHGVCFMQKNTGIVPNALYEYNSTGSSYHHIFGGGSGCTKTSGEIYKPTSLPPTELPPPPPPPVTTTNTKLWTFNKIWSDETLNGWGDKNELIQGYSSSWNTGRWTGYMQMTDDFTAIRNTISGASNLSGRIYIQRTNSSGNATGSKLCVYGSDGTVITTTTSINRGMGVWVTLSSSVISKIQNGSIKYFYLRADTNSTSTYFKCENNAKIEITYSK